MVLEIWALSLCGWCGYRLVRGCKGCFRFFRSFPTSHLVLLPDLFSFPLLQYFLPLLCSFLHFKLLNLFSCRIPLHLLNFIIQLSESLQFLNLSLRVGTLGNKHLQGLDERLNDAFCHLLVCNLANLLMLNEILISVVEIIWLK